MPRGEGPGRPPTWTGRQLTTAYGGVPAPEHPGRDVPERYGPWDRVYDLFRRWQRNGTCKRILERLQTEVGAKGLITWEASVDCTVCRAHQHTAGARKKGISRKSLPAASTPSRMTMSSGGPAAGGPRRLTSPPNRGKGPCLSSSRPGTGTTARSFNGCSRKFGSPHQSGRAPTLLSLVNGEFNPRSARWPCPGVT
ncbi:hypothetical protein ABZZ47_09125 [Streptomyces sp. NPDC006465]|uniref:transposase n=1 Tax=Streptomyces sp. NPDC006465 TaxID=3157174 RepID=UPI0033B9FD3B